MSFIPDARIESRAAELWRRYQLTPSFDIEKLLDQLRLGLLWDCLPANVLGALKPEERLVVLNERRLSEFKATPGLERFTVAHEVGHDALHADDAWTGVLPMMEDGRIWCRDGSHDSTEFQASRFASYLLVPTDELRSLLPSAPWNGWSTVYGLAEAFGVTPTAMIVRLRNGGYAHQSANGTPTSGPPPDETSTAPLLPGL